FISEVDHLSTTIDLMKTTISRFLILIESLSEETDFDRLLHHISAETLSASDATAVLPLTLSEDESCLNPTRLVMANEEGREIQEHLSLPLSALGIELISEDHGKIERFHLSDKQPHPLSFLLDELALESLDLVIIPLRNRQHDLTGVLCLVFSGKDCDLNSPEMADRLDFVNALSRFAAVSIESRQLLNMQEALLDAFIKLLAGAIDAKSPYTGGHCQRVPAITEMLAKAACDETDGPFADFQLNTKEWEALDIASWLHDCGKVTTPEYVVDKATKLETITDRIHEIRTRFEVLKRDEEITFWKKLDAGEDRN
ncbi:MAG: HD-GYP domain-containing protein, partial [bacterium]